jgi:hypothetical protein
MVKRQKKLSLSSLNIQDRNAREMKFRHRIGLLWNFSTSMDRGNEVLELKHRDN